MAKLKLFVTGTDTEIGKTYFCLQFLQQCAQQGLTTVALKPLASGCEMGAVGLRNQDALSLQNAATIPLPYETVNPIALQPAIAPHIAAQQAGITLSVSSLIQNTSPVFNLAVDLVLIESCGGWFCPLNQHETIADFAIKLDIPVILVVGLRLGCLNQTLLTWQAMQHRSVRFAGWVANLIDPNMACIAENINTITQYVSMPPLAVLPYDSNSR